MSDDLYFEPPSRLQLVDKLVHLLRFSNTFLILSGPTGAGVSTVMNQLHHHTAEDSVCALSVSLEQNTNLTMLHQLLNNTIDEVINPDEFSDPDPLTQLHQKIDSLIKSQQNLLILIDNADLLNDDAVQSLVNMQGANQGSMAVVLGGSEKISSLATQLIQNESLAGNLHTEILSPFNQLETQEFIQLRFVRGGDFSRKQLADIYQSSAGYPGRIMKMTTEMIQSGKIKFNQKTGFLPIPHMIGIALLLTGITAVSSWQYFSDDELIVDSELASTTTELPIVIEDVDDAPIGLDTAPLDEAQISTNLNSQNQNNQGLEAGAVNRNKVDQFGNKLDSNAQVIQSELNEHRSDAQALENQISSLSNKIKVQENLLDSVLGDVAADVDDNLINNSHQLDSPIKPSTDLVSESADATQQLLNAADQAIQTSNKVLADTSNSTKNLDTGSNQVADVDSNTANQEAVISVDNSSSKATVDNIINEAKQRDETIIQHNEKTLKSQSVQVAASKALIQIKVNQRLNQLSAVLKQNINPDLLNPAAVVTTQSGVEVKESSISSQANSTVQPSQIYPENTVVIDNKIPSQNPQTFSLDLVNTRILQQNTSTNIGRWSGAAAIKKWPSSGYTLQILGAKSKASVIKFLSSAPNSEKMYHFETRLKDQPWNVIVYGQYPSHAAANAAIAKLPTKLRQLKPWAKSIKSVKNAIK